MNAWTEAPTVHASIVATPPRQPTVLWCACGTRITGRPYVEATNPPGSNGPYLCHACAAEHCRERPGDLRQIAHPGTAGEDSPVRRPRRSPGEQRKRRGRHR